MVRAPREVVKTDGRREECSGDRLAERSKRFPVLSLLNHGASLTFLLRLGTFLCFAGWTWVHFYWEGPYGVLLWHETTFGIAEKFGVSWEAFVGTGANDGLVQKLISAMGWLYLACTILALTVRKTSHAQMAALIGGSGLLIVLNYAKYLTSQKQLPMFVEHGGQMLMPVLLVLALKFGPRHRATVVTALVAFILTFAGHGSYAAGLWPTPSHFFGMTTLILGIEFAAAKTLLLVAGGLDFLICVTVFIPCLRRASLLYATVWGFLTAIARPAAGMSLELNYWGADQYLQEAVLRAPHFLIPLYLYCYWRESKSANVTSEGVAPADSSRPSGHTRGITATF